MRKLRYLQFFIIAILILPTINNCDINRVKFRLEKIREIPLKLGEGKLTGKIWDIALDEDKRHYFLVDRKIHTIWVVDEKGKLFQQIGSQGQGPGELQDPVSIVLLNDRVAVLEAKTQRISYFRGNGIYIKSIPLGGVGDLTGMEFSDQNTIFVSESLGIRNYDFYTKSGEQISQHITKQNFPLLMPSRLPGGQVSSTSDGNLLYSSITQYNVKKLNWRGETMVNYNTKPQGFISRDLTSIEKARKQNDWALVGLPLEMNKFVLIQWFKKQINEKYPKEVKWERYIDLFTPEGKPIQQRLSVPITFFLAQNGKLYGVDNAPMERGAKNPSIVVYQIRGDGL